MSEHLRELIRTYQQAKVTCTNEQARKRIEEVISMLFQELEVSEHEQRRINKYKGTQYGIN